MPGAVSGKGGNCLTRPIGATTPAVEVDELTKWSFNPKCNNPAWASNRTGGFKRRRAGIRDGSGSIEGKWDPTNPITDRLEDGTEIELQLQTTGAQMFTVPAIIDGLKLDVDLDSGDIIGWSADWSLNGPWVKPTPLPATFAGGAGVTGPAGPAGGDEAQQATQGGGQGVLPQGGSRATQGGQAAAQSPREHHEAHVAAQAQRQAQQGQQAQQAQQAGASPQDLGQLIAQAVMQALAGHPAFNQQPAPGTVVARPAA